MNVSLEDQALQLRNRIVALQERLDKVKARIHRKYVKESGLVGRIARSERLPEGIQIDDVVFKTWAPREPQAVSGYRLDNPDAYRTIHLITPGFQIDE
ncbi:hypothetical protein [Rhizobium sp. Leaf383]|uniref:hypothetical protein n=1 Tax=Rhizobium sp. Leaf383 TaxID=1736357 RepID=UPI000712EE23|nr:hypothetical protein [Rhizobium sp. Leaf383]KQS84308.1 hypothetical protein ASG58_21295 [Rhizobium sp. Leaf383]